MAPIANDRERLRYTRPRPSRQPRPRCSQKDAACAKCVHGCVRHAEIDGLGREVGTLRLEERLDVTGRDVDEPPRAKRRADEVLSNRPDALRVRRALQEERDLATRQDLRATARKAADSAGSGHLSLCGTRSGSAYSASRPSTAAVQSGQAGGG